MGVWGAVNVDRVREWPCRLFTTETMRAPSDTKYGLRQPVAPQANVRDNGSRIHNLFTVQVYLCLTVVLSWPRFRSALGSSFTFASAFPTEVSYSTKHSRAPVKAYIRRSFRLG